MGKFDTLLAQADIKPLGKTAATTRDPNKDRTRLYTFAEIAGEDPLTVLDKANAGNLAELLKEYEAKAFKTLMETPPNKLTEQQLNGVVELFNASQIQGKRWDRFGDGEGLSPEDKKKEEARKVELVQALNTIFDADETKKKTAFGALIGAYGGQYIGGDKGMLDKAALDKLRSMGDDGAQLADRYSADLKKDGTARDTVVEFARRFVGFSEYGWNRGPMVAMSMGYEGDPYCGGGMNMIYDRVFGPELFDQKSFRSAASYAQIGAAHNALRAPGQPAKPGDIILFSGSGRSGYHVGMVTEVNANGQPTKYLDFNGRSQGVAESTMRRSYRGTVDIEALAKAKGLIGPDKELKTLEDLIAKAEKDFKALQEPPAIKLDKAAVDPAKASELAAVVPHAVRDKAAQPALT